MFGYFRVVFLKSCFYVHSDNKSENRISYSVGTLKELQKVRGKNINITPGKLVCLSGWCCLSGR